jgi:hypothetical protein
VTGVQTCALPISLINSKIDKMFNLAEELGLAEVIDSQMELFTV